MHPLTRILIALALPLAAVGCASSTLTLSLDLYEDDPSYLAPLSNQQVTTLYDSLATAEQEAELLAAARKDLAQQMVDAYVIFYHAASRARVKERNSKADFTRAQAVEELRNDHQLFSDLANFKREVDVRLASFRSVKGQAAAALREYLQQRRAAATPGSDPDQHEEPLKQQLAALAAVDEVHPSLIDLSSHLGTDFERVNDENWGKAATIVEVNAKAVPGFRELSRELRKLETRLRDLEAKGLSVADGLLKRVSSIESGLKDDRAALRKSAAAVAAVMTDVPDSLGLGDRGRSALAELTSSASLFFSQIDRLQDPADPVWRIVSDPDNEERWNSRFTETYFRAKGDSSVVVVRDTPISFRVQRGDNDPTALVRSQLQISRAISGAAISIAGAATGVNLAEAPAADGTGTQPGDAGVAESERLAKKKAEIESQERQRATAASVLTTHLLSLRSQLVQADDDARKGIQSQLAGILAAYQPILTGTEDDEDTTDDEDDQDTTDDEDPTDDATSEEPEEVEGFGP